MEITPFIILRMFYCFFSRMNQFASNTRLQGLDENEYLHMGQQMPFWYLSHMLKRFPRYPAGL